MSIDELIRNSAKATNKQKQNPQESNGKKSSKDKEVEQSPFKNKRRSVVKAARQWRDSDFQKSYSRNNYQEACAGQRMIIDLLTFKSPLYDDGEKFPIWQPLDRKEILNEGVRYVQRSPRKARPRFFKDIEVFLVFKALFNTLKHPAKVKLINRWKKEHGSTLPEGGKSRDSPLYWLKSNSIFWNRGGRFWWWAYHALEKDKGFMIDNKGRVLISLPEMNRIFTS